MIVLAATTATAVADTFRISRDSFAVTVKSIAVLPINRTVQSVVEIVRADDAFIQEMDSLLSLEGNTAAIRSKIQHAGYYDLMVTDLTIIDREDKNVIMDYLQKMRLPYYTLLKPVTNNANRAYIDSMTVCGANAAVAALLGSGRYGVARPEICEAIRTTSSCRWPDTALINELLTTVNADAVLSMTIAMEKAGQLHNRGRYMSSSSTFAVVLTACAINCHGDTIWTNRREVRKINQGDDVAAIFTASDIQEAARSAVDDLIK